MKSLFHKDINCLRIKGQRIDGTWQEGDYVPDPATGDPVWTAGGRTPFVVSGSIQPAKDALLKNVDEVRRRRGGIRVVYATDVLRTVEGDLPPDIVLYEGREYEVFGESKYNSGIISHNRYYIQEVNDR